MLFDGEATIRIREGDELVWTTGTQIAYSLPVKKGKDNLYEVILHEYAAAHPNSRFPGAGCLSAG